MAASYVTLLRRAFTLVELLVVIAIMGILVALLLPAVQAAREAARRMQCQNKLKQLGLATLNYESTYRRIPPGDYKRVYGTWLVILLPYVEQQTAFDRYFGLGATQTYGSAADGNLTTNYRYFGTRNFNAGVVLTQFPAYTCPSDSITATNSVYSGYTFHNYVGNYGNTSPWRRPIQGVQYAGAPFIVVSDPTSPTQVGCPTPDRLQAQKLSDIVDGMSNTLLFSETVQGRGGDLRGFAWWGGGCHFETYLPPNTNQPDVMEASYYCYPSVIGNPPCVNSNNNLTTPETFAARSRHSGGVLTCQCDGSCRFVSNSIDLVTWRAVGSARGSEAASDF